MKPLQQFIHDLQDLTTAEQRLPDDALATTVGALLEELVARPDPVPAEFTVRSALHDQFDRVGPGRGRTSSYARNVGSHRGDHQPDRGTALRAAR
jgi:hypothetical protein